MIIKKVIEAVQHLNTGDKQIVHRDFHQENITVHFPDLKPSKKDMEDPNNYWKKTLLWNVVEQLKDMSDPKKFKMKIIDYGMSKLLDTKEADGNMITPNLGAPLIMAPEMQNDSI